MPDTGPGMLISSTTPWSGGFCSGGGGALPALARWTRSGEMSPNKAAKVGMYE